MKAKKFLFANIVLFILAGSCVFAQSENVVKASRRTALRCLSLAKDAAVNKDWNAVVSHSELGIAYDASIADLWYVEAVAKNALGSTKADVLELVRHALFNGSWVDYNRDGARILYADILCDTGRYLEVPNILDSKPILLSADAEYIRAKAYYRIGDIGAIDTARDKIDVARRMYPDDKRFALLFFKNESPSDSNAKVRKIAESFITTINSYSETKSYENTELEILATSFATGETQTRMLKSFNARELQHPLFPELALNAGIMNQEDAFEYFKSFADGSVSYEILLSFLKVIDNENVKNLINIYMNSYAGVILFDTDRDGIDNMYVKYSRGRPESVVYDRNQDGIIDWHVNCDFGVPINCEVNNNLFVSWNPYPYLEKVDYLSGEGDSVLKFNLVREGLNWSPLDITVDQEIVETDGLEFFIPVLNDDCKDIRDDQLIAAAANYEIPSKERQNAKIIFTILDGNAQLARYTENGKLYAVAQFNNGFPSLRSVDADGDGVFETSEFYGYDESGSMEVHSMEEERSVMINLFGLPADGTGFYVSMIQIDRDGDTIPDFTEEYLAHGGIISSWDTDRDGLWDLRYIKYPYIQKDLVLSGEEPVIEDSLFYETTQHNLVTVSSINGIPSKVTTTNSLGLDEQSVTKDTEMDFYWIGTIGTPEFAALALETLNEYTTQGVCRITSDNSDKMICVRIGDWSFGKIITSSFDNNLAEENEEDINE